MQKKQNNEVFGCKPGTQFVPPHSILTEDDLTLVDLTQPCKTPIPGDAQHPDQTPLTRL